MKLCVVLLIAGYVVIFSDAGKAKGTRLWSLNKQMNKQMNKQTNKQKAPCVLQDIVPSGIAAQKRSRDEGFSKSTSYNTRKRHVSASN